MKYLLREGYDWRCKEVTREEYCICYKHLEWSDEDIDENDTYTLWILDDDMDEIEEKGILNMREETNDKYYFDHSESEPTEVIKEVFEYYVESHNVQEFVKVNKSSNEFNEFHINLYD